MRKFIRVMVLFCILSNPSILFAQKGFHFGVKFQPTLTQIKDQNLSDSSSIDLQSTLNWGAGISISYFMAKDFAAQLELVYAGLGQKYTGIDTFGVTAYYQRFDYVNVPLVFKLTTGNEKFLGLNVHAGVQAGVLVDSRLEVRPASGGSFESSTTGNTNPVDFGFTYGAGLDFNIAKRLQLNLGLRMYNGLVDINDSGDKSHPNYSKSYNRTQSAYIGLTF